MKMKFLVCVRAFPVSLVAVFRMRNKNSTRYLLLERQMRYIKKWYVERKSNQMLHNGLLNVQSAQHVPVTIMPIIRSSRLYRWLQHVAHNTLFKAGRVVWCGAVGYASGMKDVAWHPSSRTYNPLNMFRALLCHHQELETIQVITAHGT
jgi:hypothetical protein